MGPNRYRSSPSLHRQMRARARPPASRPCASCRRGLPASLTRLAADVVPRSHHDCATLGVISMTAAQTGGVFFCPCLVPHPAETIISPVPHATRQLMLRLGAGPRRSRRHSFPPRTRALLGFAVQLGV